MIVMSQIWKKTTNLIIHLHWTQWKEHICCFIRTTLVCRNEGGFFFHKILYAVAVASLMLEFSLVKFIYVLQNGKIWTSDNWRSMTAEYIIWIHKFWFWLLVKWTALCWLIWLHATNLKFPVFGRDYLSTSTCHLNIAGSKRDRG